MNGFNIKINNNKTKIFFSIIFSVFILFNFSTFVAAQSAEDEEYFRKDNEKKALEELKREKTNKEKMLVQTNEAHELLKKYVKLGPPSEFLVSHFSLDTSADESGLYTPIDTVIKLYSSISTEHKRTFVKKKNLWIFVVNKTDELTDEKTEIIFSFVDLRKTKGYILLNRILFNGNDIPSNQIFTTVMRLLYPNGY